MSVGSGQSQPGSAAMTPQRVVLNTDPGVSAVKRRDTDPEGDPDSDPTQTKTLLFVFNALWSKCTKKYV